MHPRLRLALVLAVAALSGCTASQQERARTDVNDAVITTQIRAKIAAVDPATVSLVKVEVANRTVTLSGQVHSMQERASVEEAARSVPGIAALHDKLTVNPKAPTAKEIADDLSLQARVKGALAAQTGVNALKVQVSAHAGVVVLDGTVVSRTVHALVMETVLGVSGVKRAIDHLRIAPN